MLISCLNGADCRCTDPSHDHHAQSLHPRRRLVRALVPWTKSAGLPGHSRFFQRDSAQLLDAKGSLSEDVQFTHPTLSLAKSKQPTSLFDFSSGPAPIVPRVLLSPRTRARRKLKMLAVPEVERLSCCRRRCSTDRTRNSWSINEGISAPLRTPAIRGASRHN